MLVFFFSCGNKTKKEAIKSGIAAPVKKSELFLTIPFEEIIKDQGEIKLSEFANGVELVQFENTPKALLGRVSDIQLTKDFIFIRHNGNKLITQFSRDGKYIRHIGKLGRGPKEYALSRIFSLDEENELIYIHTNWTRKILVYNFNGEYVKTIKYKAVERTDNVWCRDSLLVSFGEPHIGNEPYVFIEHNESGDTLQTISNKNFWDKEETSRSMVSFWGQNAFYRFKDKLHMKGWYNDTIYTYDQNNKIIPKFFIDLGKHKIPNDLVYERKSTRPMPGEAKWVGVRETENYIFIPYGAHYNIQARKLLKEEEGCILFNKASKKGSAVKETKLGGFINDITGGPDFKPLFTNDTCAFVTVSAFDMKQYLESQGFENQEVKYPAEKEKLYERIKTLKEDDNHFLVIANLK